MDILKEIKNPPKKYRPAPFWSWNEKLEEKETRRQIALMDEAGLGGYFMHARGGLQTEYMGEEWFENVTAGVEEGEKRGMYAWAYDENGWPSGFGSGKVNGRGLAYQQKYLRMEEGEKQTEHTICNHNGFHFYYDVNEFYIDALDKSVVKTFLNEIYEAYYERYQSRMPGFFTDEPQISRDGIPWSFVLPEAYEKAYGEPIFPHLVELFRPVGEYEETRFRFWKLVTSLFSEAYNGQIYRWCEEHGMQYTGHMVCEESLLTQLVTNGAVMPQYEYFHIPGIDWLGREAIVPCVPLQVSSVAHQLGKKQVLTESFALTGWNVSLEEFKWLLEMQMVRGVTFLCPHLEGYSLRGIRKRDYPPSIFYQQPWWDQYHLFTGAVSRVGMLLSEGKPEFDTLLIHPQSTAWVCYDNNQNEGLSEYNEAFYQAVETLERRHVLFDLGDETIMEKHARVEGRELVIGSQRYSKIVLPPHKVLFESTKRLLAEFEANGGEVVTPGSAEGRNCIDNPNILYTYRSFDGFEMHYFVNPTKEEQRALLSVEGKKLDLLTGELFPHGSRHTFPPMGSLLIIDDHTGPADIQPEERKKALPLDGLWTIANGGTNALTLDYCDYWFDGELIEQNGHVSTVQTKACDLERAVDLKMEFRANVETVPEEVYLVCETPEIFSISINGIPLDKQDAGYYFDSSFRKLPLAGMLREGENIICLTTRFEQSETVYENIRKSKCFESEKNKLSYDMEIESIYLVGDFSVQTPEEFEELDKDAVRYSGTFSIAAPRREVGLRHIEQQGFPFYAGSMTLTKQVTLEDADFALRFSKKHANVVSVAVNGKLVDDIVWRPYEADLSAYLQPGENTIALTLAGSLRNLLGPHHLEEGESYFVAPPTFFKEPSIWDGWANAPWNDGYCFVEFGIE